MEEEGARIKAMPMNYKLTREKMFYLFMQQHPRVLLPV